MRLTFNRTEECQHPPPSPDPWDGVMVRLPFELLTDPMLSPRARAVYAVLANSGCAAVDPHPWPGFSVIAGNVGASGRAVRRDIEDLIERGWIGYDGSAYTINRRRR